MSEKPRILCVGTSVNDDVSQIAHLNDKYEVVRVKTPLRAFAQLARQPFDAIFIFPDDQADGFALAKWTQSEKILDSLPDGVALLNADNAVVWANQRLKEWSGKEDVTDGNFYSLFDNPEILGPDFCPFHTAMSKSEASGSLLRCRDDVYYHVHAAPVQETGSSSKFLIVTLRDVTSETRQQQKLAAIHKAGMKLSELTPDDVCQMQVEDRIHLLKQNILQHTKDLLKFDVVEIRLMDQETSELVPLLAEGMSPDAEKRKLYAQTQDNGVTGFVAATGKSYLCEDITKDPLFLEGSAGAKSSLTVPLIQHDEVIGTFNVESPNSRAFTESDLQFLEIFARDIAIALNTLELLVAQQANTAQASVEAIHGEVALPVDEILNDAVNLREHYIGHAPEVEQRLQRILSNARDIKTLIQKVGQKMTPVEAVLESPERSAWQSLKNRRILVVDNDESVRVAAHNLLERYFCIVETAHEGNEAILMVRSARPSEAYHAIIADIRLPDMTGYDLLIRLKDIVEPVPLILMSGFGYDSGHTLVKARQEGLMANAVLYKPFRLDQLLQTVDRVVRDVGPPQAGSA